MKEKIIVNSLGIRSKLIFPDDQLYGIKGYLLVFDNP